MKKISLLSLLAGTMLMACQQNQSPSSQNDLTQIKEEKIDPKLEQGTPNSFATKAAIGNMMEVESSALMIKRTENRDIQQLATIMVKDHSMAKKELQAIALKEQIALPQVLPTEKKNILSNLDSLKEDERNQYYAELMVKEHEEAVALFKTVGKNEKNAALAKFANSKLPTLEHHLMEARNVLKIMQIIRGDKGDRPLKISQEQSTAN